MAVGGLLEWRLAVCWSGGWRSVGVAVGGLLEWRLAVCWSGGWRFGWLPARCYVHSMDYYERHLMPQVEDALDAFRVVVLHGARQCGKTTLAKRIAAKRGGAYASLDDRQVLDAALSDPHTFLHSQPHPLVIDEIQLGMDRLVRAVKTAVDACNERGRFLLTGSTNFLTVPTISESLAGRAVIMQLWPLSQAEIVGAAQPETAADPSAGVAGWFHGEFPIGATSRTTRDDYLRLACRGGYPEPLDLTGRSRHRWFDSYISTVLGRDVAALGDIRRSAVLPRLVRLAAASTSGEVNYSAWARRLGLHRHTVEAYSGWLRTVFLVHELPAWTRNRAKRAVKRPKLHMTDTGLTAALLRLDAAGLRQPTATMTGTLLETFVVNEIAQQVSSRNDAIDLHHFRDNTGREVDIMLEGVDGGVVAVEIKATSSPTGEQCRHLAWMRDRLDRVEPGAFRAGVLLHTGTHAYKLGDRLHTVPIADLWTPSALRA